MDRRDFLQRSAAAVALVACGPVARELALAPAQVFTGDGSPLAFAADGASAMLDPSGNTVSRLSSSGAAQFRRSALGSGLGQFNNPVAAAFDSSGNMFVVDRGNHRVQVLDKNGNVSSVFGADQFAAPSAIAIDAQDRVYIADTFNHRISVWQGGTQLRTFGSTLNAPRGIALWSDGEVWVLDAGNRRIQRFDDAGNALGAIALSARIPRDIAISRDNLVYVADLASPSMQVFDRGGASQPAHAVAIDGRPAIPLYLVTDVAGEVHAAAIRAVTIDTFQPLVGSDFTLQAHTLRLRSVTALPHGRPDTRTPFSLEFLGPPNLPQRTYVLTHPTLGTLELFLVPIAAGHYEAVFS